MLAEGLRQPVKRFDGGRDVSQEDQQNSSGTVRCPEPRRCTQTLQNALSIQRKPLCLLQCISDCSCSSGCCPAMPGLPAAATGPFNPGGSFSPAAGGGRPVGPAAAPRQRSGMCGTMGAAQAERERGGSHQQWQGEVSEALGFISLTQGEKK